MEKALFDWPIVLQYDVKAKYRLISRKFSGTNQNPRASVSVRLTNQIALLLVKLSVLQLFSRSYFCLGGSSIQDQMLRLSGFLHW